MRGVRPPRPGPRRAPEAGREARPAVPAARARRTASASRCSCSSLARCSSSPRRVCLVALRFHERRDPAPHIRPPPEPRRASSPRSRTTSSQNPFTAVGLVKPGRVPALDDAVGVLAGIDYATRHVFNHGDLAGVKTIHFARWVFLDDGRRADLREQLRRHPRELHGRLHRQGRVGPERRLQQRRRLSDGRAGWCSAARRTSTRSRTTCAAPGADAASGTRPTAGLTTANIDEQRADPRRPARRR